MFKKWLLAAAISSLALPSAFASPQNATAKKAWAPSKNLLTELSAPIKGNFGQIRPPKGYLLERKQAANTEGYM